MGNLPTLKILLKRYAVSQKENDANFIIMFLSYGFKEQSPLLYLSKDERDIVKSICASLEEKEKLAVM